MHLEPILEQHYLHARIPRIVAMYNSIYDSLVHSRLWQFIPHIVVGRMVANTCIYVRHNKCLRLVNQLKDITIENLIERGWLLNLSTIKLHTFNFRRTEKRLRVAGEKKKSRICKLSVVSKQVQSRQN